MEETTTRTKADNPVYKKRYKNKCVRIDLEWVRHDKKWLQLTKMGTN